MKNCPECGRAVAEYARKCKYCDYRFVPVAPQKRRIAPRRMIAPVLLITALAAAVYLLLRPAENTTDYIPLQGNLYTGVTVNMTNVAEFQILGGNDTCGERLLLVQYPSGATEWKKRDALIQNPALRIRADDPALQEQRWQIYPCP